jgi:signal transduction histidine kinase
MQEELIDIVAHELRIPIQPILGLTEILLSNKRIDRVGQEEKLCHSYECKEVEATY